MTTDLLRHDSKDFTKNNIDQIPCITRFQKYVKKDRYAKATCIDLTECYLRKLLRQLEARL